MASARPRGRQPARRRIRGRAHFPLPAPVHPQRAQRPRYPSSILLLAAGRSAAYRLSARPSRPRAYAPTRARQKYGFGAVQKGAPYPSGRTAHTGIAGFKKSRSACQKRQGIPRTSNTRPHGNTNTFRGDGHAEAAAGGVDTSDVNPRTLESRKQPGLYFAGEVLDITGLLGGYNLHWAWASGKAVGESWKK